MISFADSLTLARTKLKSKRVMLGIAIVVSGLLFGVLCAAQIVLSGISHSAHDYTSRALDGKYLVKSRPVLPESIFGPSLIDPSKEVMAELTAMQTDYFARQKALAKELKIPFDEKDVAAILIPNPYADKALPDDKKLMINNASPIYQMYIKKQQVAYLKVAKNKLSDLKTAAASYGATAYYQNEPAAVSFVAMHYLADGKEDLAKLSQNVRPQNSDFSEYGYLTYSVRNSSYSLVDDALIKRFILPSNAKREAAPTAIPVVITTTEAVALFGQQYGITKEPKDAGKLLDWMKNLQDKMNGTTYTACYRNAAEVAGLAQKAQTALETKPSLVYNLPSQPCGPMTVKQDTRSEADKKSALQQIDISQKLGTYQEAKRQLFTFVIVGVMPVSPQTDAMKSLPAFMSSALGAQYGVGAMIPRQMFGQLPTDARHEDILLTSDSPYNADILKEVGISEAIVAFPSVEAARLFIDREGCPAQDTSCQKPFTLEPYGSNYLLVDDLTKTATNTLRTALPIAVAIAGIIIWATMARVIIDSRHETAVYRAIGAKRRDIMAIYLLYSFIVALRIVGFSVLLGAGIAWLVQIFYGAQATDYAKITYGVFDQGQAFSFIGVEPVRLAWLALCIIGISLLAVLPSLVRNVRRNPIDDMRDE